MKNTRVFLGFLITPIILAIAIGVMAIFTYEIQELNVSNMLFITSSWFLNAIPYSYISILLFGIPSFYILNKYRISSGIAYSAIGLIIGLIVSACILPFGYDFVSAIIFVVSAVSGLLAASTFWLIAVCGSNKSLKDAP